MRRHERTPTRFIYVQGPASVLGRFLAYANELKADPYWEEWTSFCPKKGSEGEVPEVVLAPEPAGGARDLGQARQGPTAHAGELGIMP
jgi:hypothetical protein